MCKCKLKKVVEISNMRYFDMLFQDFTVCKTKFCRLSMPQK